MRAFIAIDLPDSIRQTFAREQKRFRVVCRDARWTRPEGIHLTLKFLGQISDAKAGQVVKALQSMERFNSFTVRVQGFGFFPDAKRPKVFWAGLDAPEDLAHLAGEVESAMASLGFPRENRAFKPHLTLARFKIPQPQPGLQSLLNREEEALLGSFAVSDFFLWESKLSPQGAEYRQVARLP